jgi:hypothetical protein
MLHYRFHISDPNANVFFEANKGGDPRKDPATLALTYMWAEKLHGAKMGWSAWSACNLPGQIRAVLLV